MQATNTCKSSKITPSIYFFTTRRLPSMKRTVGTPASLGRSGAVRKPAVSTAPEPVRMMSMKYQPQLRGSLATEFSLFHSGQRLFYPHRKTAPSPPLFSTAHPSKQLPSTKKVRTFTKPLQLRRSLLRFTGEDPVMRTSVIQKTVKLPSKASFNQPDNTRPR